MTSRISKTDWGLRTFEPVCPDPLPGLDYGAVRPFQSWLKGNLVELIENALSSNPPRMELATLALEELRARGKPGKALSLFDRVGLPPISWLGGARQAVSVGGLAPATGGRSRGSVYAILRWGYAAEGVTWGAYVGSTRKPVAKRFLEHRTGIRGARGLQAHGVEPLYSLIAGLNPFPGRECELRETRLHQVLKTVIPRVSGNTIPVDDPAAT